MNETFKKLQESLARDFTKTSLKVMITLWAAFVIVMAWTLDNTFLLAGLLAYEVLP